MVAEWTLGKVPSPPFPPQRRPVKITSSYGPLTNNLRLLGISTMGKLQLDVQPNFLKRPNLPLASLECCRPNWRVFFFFKFLDQGWTCGPCIGNLGSQPLGCQRSSTVGAVFKSTSLTHVKMNLSNQTEAGGLKKEQVKSCPRVCLVWS